MNNFLVTGGAGFIGSHLVDLLLADGQRVAVLDNFSYGKRAYLPINHSNLTVFTGDLLDTAFVRSVFEAFRPEIVYHLAAIHHIPTCERQPAIALRTNVEGSEILFDHARAFNVTTVVFASSGAVYEILDGQLQEDSSAAVPHDIYSISKNPAKICFVSIRNEATSGASPAAYSMPLEQEKPTNILYRTSCNKCWPDRRIFNSAT